MRDISLSSDSCRLELCLEHGISGIRCECLRIGPRGIVFHSKFRIELMSGVLVRLECKGGGCASGKVATEGVVVGCREIGSSDFEITIFFELPLANDARECGEALPSWN